MGKKRVQSRQLRQQVRQVRPKGVASAPSAQQQKRQRQRYVASGGLLQGYAPEFVVRIGFISGIAIAVFALIIVELIVGPISPHGLAVKIIAALAWLFPIVLLVSFVGPGVRLGWADRKKESLLIQGQLMGASSVSTSLGLGMIMVKTRGGTEQFLCPPDKLAKVPGNVVNVTLTLTPGLRHVRGVSLIGQRMMGRPEPPVPPVLRQLRMLPIITPLALAAAVVVGDDAVAFAPLTPDALHALAAALAAAVLGVAIYALSFLVQRRLMAAVQAIVPGGLG
ncbi:MAG: hypothetical protein ACREPA_11635 [Candidatus Dormibacteraceae bacterium]